MVPGQDAAGVQQLLEHLVIGRKLDFGGNIQFLQPEPQRFLDGLGGEVGADGNGQSLFARARRSSLRL